MCRSSPFFSLFFPALDHRVAEGFGTRHPGSNAASASALNSGQGHAPNGPPAHFGIATYDLEPK